MDLLPTFVEARVAEQSAGLDGKGLVQDNYGVLCLGRGFRFEVAASDVAQAGLGTPGAKGQAVIEDLDDLAPLAISGNPYPATVGEFGLDWRISARLLANIEFAPLGPYTIAIVTPEGRARQGGLGFVAGPVQQVHVEAEEDQRGRRFGAVGQLRSFQTVTYQDEAGGVGLALRIRLGREAMNPVVDTIGDHLAVRDAVNARLIQKG
ncbi:hypothetical protein UM91_05495 [Pseudomonas oryzihabitans]|nr:hypothetical protein UM91_05495 [Pseudomonas oryzihabitans]